MLRTFNAFLVIAVLVAGFFLYSLEHSIRKEEREIARIETRISYERETIKLLSAEWNSLTRPERLQSLAEQYLKLKNTTPDQFITRAEIAQRVPAEPQVRLEEKGKDAIGDILKAME